MNIMNTTTTILVLLLPKSVLSFRRLYILFATTTTLFSMRYAVISSDHNIGHVLVESTWCIVGSVTSSLKGHLHTAIVLLYAILDCRESEYSDLESVKICRHPSKETIYLNSNYIFKLDPLERTAVSSENWDSICFTGLVSAWQFLASSLWGRQAVVMF